MPLIEFIGGGHFSCGFMLLKVSAALVKFF